jgi:YHS domain-containing protein
MVALSGSAAEPPVYVPAGGVAISGYDPVAYFAEGEPVEGSPQYAYVWQGATWRFASQAHLDEFKVEPARYAPQFGGYCAWAVSQGYTASADPLAWRIVKGKLYLNYNLDVKKTWQKDIAGNIAKGEANWPAVLDR